MNELDVLDRLIRDFEPDPAARANAASRLQIRMRPFPPPPRRSRRPWTLAASVAVVTGIAAVLIGTSADDKGALRIGPVSAQAALTQVAGVAANREDPLLQPGEYWYVQDRSRYMGTVAEGKGYSFLGTGEVRRTWTGYDGSGRYSTQRIPGDPEFFGPRDRARWVAAGRPALQGASAPEGGRFNGGGFSFGGRKLTYQQLQALPTDGPGMYRELIKAAGDSGNSPDGEAFTIIGDILRNLPVPPRARAGLYRAAASIKGIRLVGRVNDDLGRPGIAVELTDRGTRQRLIFDPETALLLEEQQVLDRPNDYLDATPGTVTGQRLAVKQGIVASDQDLP